MCYASVRLAFVKLDYVTLFIPNYLKDLTEKALNLKQNKKLNIYNLSYEWHVFSFYVTVAKSNSNRNRNRVKNYVLFSYFISQALSRLGNPQCKTFTFKLHWKPHFLTLSHNPPLTFFMSTEDENWSLKPCLQFLTPFSFPFTPFSPLAELFLEQIIRRSSKLPGSTRKNIPLTNKRASLNIKILHRQL